MMDAILGVMCVPFIDFGSTKTWKETWYRLV